MVERLVDRRDSASAATASRTRPRARSTCPTRCRARPPRSINGPAIPTAGISSRSTARAPTASRRSARISELCGGCALQHLAHGALPRIGSGPWWSEALAQAGLDAAVDDLIDAHGDGRRRAVFHARRGTHDVLEVGFAALQGASAWWRSIAVPILAPGLDGAIETAWAIAEALGAETRKPLDIQVTATETGLDVDVRGSGPLTAARAGELAAIADRRRLARLTRHGEMVAQRTKPTVRIGPRRAHAAAGRLPAGNGRGRGRPGAAGGDALRRGENSGRPVLRRRTVRAAARRTRPHHRGRQRRGRDRRLAARRDRRRKASSRSRRSGATSSAGRSCRSNSSASTPSCSIRRGRAPRRRRARSPASAVATGGRGLVQSRQPSRAMRAS